MQCIVWNAHSGRTTCLLELCARIVEQESERSVRVAHLLCRRDKMLTSPPCRPLCTHPESTLANVFFRYVSSATEIVQYFADVLARPEGKQPCVVAIDDLADLIDATSASERKRHLMRCLALAHEHARCHRCIVAVGERSQESQAEAETAALPPLASFYQRWLPHVLCATITDSSKGCFQCTALQLVGCTTWVASSCEYSFTRECGLEVLGRH